MESPSNTEIELAANLNNEILINAWICLVRLSKSHYILKRALSYYWDLKNVKLHSLPKWIQQRLRIRDSQDDINSKIRSTHDKANRKLINCIFYWNQNGQSVYLVGSFTDWLNKKIKMNPHGHEFIAVVDLPKDIHYYKFIVDDQWKCASNQAIHTHENGEVNNVLDLRTYTPIDLIHPEDYKKSCHLYEQIVCQNLNLEFNQMISNIDHFTVEAPSFPIVLFKNSIISEPYGKLPAPSHVFSNHVYLDTYSASIFGPHTVCVASTQRWKNLHKCLSSTAGQKFNTILYITLNDEELFYSNSNYQIQVVSELIYMLCHRNFSKE